MLIVSIDRQNVAMIDFDNPSCGHLEIVMPRDEFTARFGIVVPVDVRSASYEPERNLYLVEKTDGAVDSFAQPDKNALLYAICQQASTILHAAEGDHLGSDYQWNETTQAWEMTTEAAGRIAKEQQVAALKKAMCDKLDQGVTVKVNDREYLMDAWEADATKLKHGVELAQLNGETTMDLVGHENQIYAAVPVDDVLEVARQVANNYRSEWYAMCVARANILAAEH